MFCLITAPLTPIPFTPIPFPTWASHNVLPTQYKHELRTISVSDQLTPEALMSLLQLQRVAPPLLLHQSLKEVVVRAHNSWLPGSKRGGANIMSMIR